MQNIISLILVALVLAAIVTEAASVFAIIFALIVIESLIVTIFRTNTSNVKYWRYS